MPGDSGSLLNRLLGMAVTLCIAAVLVVISVRLIESVLEPLLIGVGVLGGLTLVGWFVIRRRNNRYW